MSWTVPAVHARTGEPLGKAMEIGLIFERHEMSDTVGNVISGTCIQEPFITEFT